MEKQFEIIRKTRQFLLDIVSDLSTEQLNEIPEGFNNNIIWNLTHLIAAQQGVSYVRGGLPLRVEERYFEFYKPGTRPDASVDAEEIGKVREMLRTTIDQLEEDYHNNAFTDYKPWTNRYGVEHRDINDTINFLLFHEGIHLGYIMALKRVVGMPVNG